MKKSTVFFAFVLAGSMLRPTSSCIAADVATISPTTRPAPVNTVDVTNFGAIGDGKTLNTAKIQTAVDACSAKGGGIVNFPAGRYITGTIQIKDNVTLQLDEKAILLGSTNAADYRNVDPFSAGDGVQLGYALITAIDAHHVGIEGKGTIDGQGKALAATQTPYTVRPFLIRWIRCTDVTLKDINLASPGAWTNHFFQCTNVAVDGVKIRSAATGLRNNDGIDIDSCQSVRISSCDIESGDDAICIKTTSAHSCTDIFVSDCKLKTRCNAIKLGTESLGDFQRIQATHCDIHDTGMAGVALYCVDGANMHDISIADIAMDNVIVPISIRLGARLKTFRSGDHSKPVGTLHDVRLKNVHAIRAGRIGLLINGIPDHFVEALTLENIQIELTGGGKAKDAEIQFPEKETAYPEMSMFGKVFPAYGAYLRHIRGASLKDVRITTKKADARPVAVLIDVQGTTAADFTTAESAAP